MFLQHVLFLWLALIICSPKAIAEFAITEVASGIYVHLGRSQLPDRSNKGAIANIGFIVGDSCVAVIDTGGNPRQGYRLKKAIKKITKKPICYVINTHVHPDHIFGNIAFKRVGAVFVGHHKLTRSLSARGSYYLNKAGEQLGISLSSKHIIPPDIVVKDSLQIDLGNRQLTLTAQPTAHTDNDLTIFDRQTNTIWLADLLFLKRIPVLDGSIKGWLGVLKDMEKRQFNTVIAGHGAITSNWRVGLRRQKKYLQTLVAEIRPMIAEGIFLEEAIRQVGYAEKHKWQFFNQVHPQNITNAFAELEWE